VDHLVASEDHKTCRSAEGSRTLGSDRSTHCGRRRDRADRESGHERVHLDPVGNVQMTPSIVFLIDQMWVK